MAVKRPAVVVGLGEVLWDCFPNRRRPGGAPANVAYHAGQLGLRGVVCTRVGGDPLGDELLAFLQEHGLSIDDVQRDPRRPTGRVDVEFNRGEPTYTFADDVAWDHLEATPAWLAVVAGAGAVCFGTLAQRAAESREAIRGCLSAAGNETLIVYDVNLREPWYDVETIEASLQMADLVKLNEHEVEVLSNLLELGDGALGRDLDGFAAAIGKVYGPAWVCVTRGAEGSWLGNGDQSAEHPGVAIDDPHPVGAGDAFTAAMIFAKLRGWPLEKTIAFAAEAASLVVRHEGAMPDVARDYHRLIEQYGGDG